jgi:archaeal cell division control protein 6
MSQKISCGNQEQRRYKNTQLIIKKASSSEKSNKITINEAYLDEEKLPEEERIKVLEEIFHRNIRTKQLELLARFLSPILRNELPQNLLIYGPSGTGKSVTCLHFLSVLASMCQEEGVSFGYYYVDLTTPRTCFGALNELAIGLDNTVKRYRKGIAIDHMQAIIIQILSEKNGIICILIDEVDNITDNSDIFYTFLAKTLPRKVPVRLVYIFLTNRLEWEKSLDPRILSVLKKNDMIFNPYNAMDLIEILKLRVEKALDIKKVENAAIHKIAAYASRETGDARKAVELLAKAVKIAEDTSGRLTEIEVDTAENRIEVDKTEQLIKALALQQKFTLIACYSALAAGNKKLTTGQVYDTYHSICSQEKLRPLTQRRFSDMVSFLDLYGLIKARVISQGRYGKTREISSSLPKKFVKSIVEREI